MSDNEASPDQDLQDWRERCAEFERMVHEPEGDIVEIDVGDLIGAKGRVVPPPAEPAEGAEDGVTHNFLVVREGLPTVSGDSDRTRHGQFPAVIEETIGRDAHIAIAAQLLSRLASRRASEIVDALGRAVNDLREPLRTVAIAGLYSGEPADSPKELASWLGTSAETIEFVSEIALDQLAAHLHFD